ncbi:hypothetical protein [Lachnospira multipara]|uniref:hypothetical protein n=1 Tax=Lachnospira multipara TaxID=28051 RepID=UPI0004E0CDC3|nr:hypothetical protein [Lachnospira multipara]
MAAENAISLDEFSSYFKEVDITLDNWEDYFQLDTREEVSKDAFGDFDGTVTTYEIIKPKSDNFIILGEKLGEDERVVFRLMIAYKGESGNYAADGTKVSGEDPFESSEEMDVSLWKNDLSYDILEIERTNPDPEDESLTFKMSKNITDMQCSKVKSRILVASIPDTAWLETENGKCIIVEDGSGLYYYLYDDGSSEYDGQINHQVSEGEWHDSLQAFKKWTYLDELLKLE